MSSARLLASALETFWVVLALFVVHRALTVAPLTAALDLSPGALAQALVVGLLSDAWVATLLTLVILGVMAALCALGRPRWARASRLALLMGLGLLGATHQAYVDFFHFQIVPFHLRYLLDRDFMLANAPSSFEPRGLLHLAIPLLVLVIIRWVDPLAHVTPRRLAAALGVMAGLGLLAHNRNIHLRVQWFVPENLQVNALERLYLEVKHHRSPRPLTLDEARSLAQELKASEPFTQGLEAGALFRLLTRPAGDEEGLLPAAKAIKGAFDQARSQGRRPIVLVTLLESLRPSETGYFAPKAPSLTPQLDALASRGLVFTQAFSTGSVTRGAQEATFCGYLGSRDTSLMRGQAVARYGCLPEVVGEGADTFWYHGGEGRFDNQRVFWASRAVKDLLSSQDFPTSTPRTGWGIGDRTFLRAALERLVALHARSQASYLLGMNLTLSNHIPWELPADARPDFTPPADATHPSQITTAYADLALGEFIAGLRERALWDQMVLVVASDHGNLVPPRNDLYGAVPHRSHLLQSHVNLVLSGGLVEAALAQVGQQGQRQDDVVSLADVAPLIAYLVGAGETRLMGQNPLIRPRALPVLAALENELFDPQSKRSWPRRDVVGGAIAPSDEEERKALFYYRAFLQFINTWSPD